MADNVVTKAFLEATQVMVDKVAALPALYNGKTVGQILGEVVQQSGKSLSGFYDELRLIGKPLDDFGVKAHDQLAKLLERDLGYFPGEKALRGNIRLFDKLVVGNGDRWDDFIQLFKKADGTVDKDNLKASLEAFKDATDATTTQPKFYLKNPEVAHPNGFIYNSREDLFQSVAANGKWELRSQNAMRGEYASFDSYSDASEAASKLQLIDFGNSAKYRYEFDVSAVSDKTRIPYGAGDEGSVFEPLCRDYTGVGGGSQVLIEKDIPIKAIYDISVSPPKKVWDSVSGLIP